MRLCHTKTMFLKIFLNKTQVLSLKLEQLDEETSKHDTRITRQKNNCASTKLFFNSQFKNSKKTLVDATTERNVLTKSLD